MAELKRYTCIGCPMSCPLQLVYDGTEIKEISGYECDRGAKYAKQEFNDPRRGLSTTIPVKGGLWKRLPVRVTKPIPKYRVMEAAREIHKLRIDIPVKQGQVLIKDLLGENGIDVIASRTMGRSEEP